MDLRVKRTRQNIINAFITLRASKPLEKITIKELAELSMINKATFYLHYQDIYHLSDTLENEVIHTAINDIPEFKDFLNDPYNTTKTLFRSFNSQGQLFKILFEGNRTSVFIEKFESLFKDLAFKAYPTLDNPEGNIYLSLLIQGIFHAYTSNRKYGEEILNSTLAAAAEKIILLIDV